MNITDRRRLAKQAKDRIGGGWDIVVCAGDESVLWTLITPLLRIDCMAGKPNWYVGQATFDNHRHRETSKSLVRVVNGLRRRLQKSHKETGRALDTLIPGRTKPQEQSPSERRAENQRRWRMQNNIDDNNVG